MVDLYRFARSEGVELATSALHNAFQFHKSDNVPYDRVRVAREIEGIIVEMLNTWSVKNWFRAYLNLGLIAKTLGQDRLIPCTAASDFVFIDPWSDVYACNVRPDLLMGNLGKQSWSEILEGPLATTIREQVGACKQNCWMVTTARTAMRSRRIPALPKRAPLELGSGEQVPGDARASGSVRPICRLRRRQARHVRPAARPVSQRQRQETASRRLDRAVRALRTFFQPIAS